jgi:hypothetical protein
VKIVMPPYAVPDIFTALAHQTNIRSVRTTQIRAVTEVRRHPSWKGPVGSEESMKLMVHVDRRRRRCCYSILRQVEQASEDSVAGWASA